MLLYCVRQRVHFAVRSIASLLPDLRKQQPAKRMQLKFDPRTVGLKEMTDANRALFTCHLSVPALKVHKHEYIKMRRLLKNLTLDNAVTCKKYQTLSDDDPLHETHKWILLDPDAFSLDKLDDTSRREVVETLAADESKAGLNADEYFEQLPIKLTYDDFKFDDILKAVLPESLAAENVNAKGYSIIGHIAHFNLRDKIMDYKYLIGQVLLDKITHIKTVVNKLNEIDNTYRNFNFEVLAGSPDTLVQCKENNCQFRFDFANVYWNPRLGTEHERIVQLLNPNDVVYDVMAGVGPFSVPAATHRKCTALCNDLNPNSYRFLVENFALNNKSKIRQQKIMEQRFGRAPVVKATVPLLHDSPFSFDSTQNFLAYNLDGHEFIKTKIKYHLIEMLRHRETTKDQVIDVGCNTPPKYVVLMNLPGMALEFLCSFKQLYTAAESRIIADTLSTTTIDQFRLQVFCYHFCKSGDDEYELIRKRIVDEIYGDATLEVTRKWVRKVAPSKEMYCSMFALEMKKHLLTMNEGNDEMNTNNEDVRVKNKLTDEAADEIDVTHPAKISRVEVN